MWSVEREQCVSWGLCLCVSAVSDFGRSLHVRLDLGSGCDWDPLCRPGPVNLYTVPFMWRWSSRKDSRWERSRWDQETLESPASKTGVQRFRRLKPSSPEAQSHQDSDPVTQGPGNPDPLDCPVQRLRPFPPNPGALRLGDPEPLDPSSQENQGSRDNFFPPKPRDLETPMVKGLGEPWNWIWEPN